MEIRVTANTDIFIDAKHIADATEAVANLNAEHEKKTGRMYNAPAKPVDSTSLGEPGVFFSWVPWNYDELHPGDIVGMLSEFGWHFHEDADGNLTYDASTVSKLGAEFELFETLAPFVDESSVVEFITGDDETVRFTFEDGKMSVVDG